MVNFGAHVSILSSISRFLIGLEQQLRVTWYHVRVTCCFGVFHLSNKICDTGLRRSEYCTTSCQKMSLEALLEAAKILQDQDNGNRFII